MKKVVKIEEFEASSSIIIKEGRSINKISKELSDTVSKMKELAPKFNSSKGDEREKIKKTLLELTAKKKELLKELDDAVLGKDKNIELELSEELKGHAKKMKEDGVSDEEIKKMHPEVSDEDLKEARGGVKVTKNWWKKASEEEREQAMLSIIKDPDDIDYDMVDGKWEDLEGWMQRDMMYFESKVNEKLARGLKPLLKQGLTITKGDGEDALTDLSDNFDELGDEQADDIASHLNMAIELMQDGYKADATKKLKQFNKACKDVLSGKEVGSAFESKVNEARRIQTKRKYTENHPSKTVGYHAKTRNKVLEAIKDGRITQDEFDNIIKEFSKDGKRWLKRNGKMFNISEEGISLSRFGKRILKGITVNEKFDRKKDGDYSDYGLSDEFSTALDNLPEKDFNPKNVVKLAKKMKQDEKEALQYAKDAFGWMKNMKESKLNEMKSNIAKKWSDYRTIGSDLKEFIDNILDANGPEGVELFVEALDDAMRHGNEVIKNNESKVNKLNELNVEYHGKGGLDKFEKYITRNIGWEFGIDDKGFLKKIMSMVIKQSRKEVEKSMPEWWNGTGSYADSEEYGVNYVDKKDAGLGRGWLTENKENKDVVVSKFKDYNISEGVRGYEVGDDLKDFDGMNFMAAQEVLWNDDDFTDAADADDWKPMMKIISKSKYKQKLRKHLIHSKEDMENFAKWLSSGMHFKAESKNPLNEKWNVDVEEPFSDKKEKGAQVRYAFKFAPIKMIDAEGFIQEDETEVMLTFSNGDKLEYLYTYSPTRPEKSISIRTGNGSGFGLTQTQIENYMGNAGTIIGDLGNVYTDFQTGVLKLGQPNKN